MNDRLRLIRRIASEISAISTVNGGITRVGIDGVDGAGKTCFADELATCFDGIGVIRASVDGFHNPRAVRHSRGKNSPEGFYEDSFNYPQLREYLLDPLSPGGSLRYRSEAFDHVTDQRVDSPVFEARVPSILIFDGIFDPIHTRYVRGQKIYAESCDPMRHATIVIDNEDLEHPHVDRRRRGRGRNA